MRIKRHAPTDARTKCSLKEDIEYAVTAASKCFKEKVVQHSSISCLQDLQFWEGFGKVVQNEMVICVLLIR